jgi:predicted naringenin-chalcone synthase
MAFHIAGLGTATPPFVIEQHDAAGMADLVTVAGDNASANVGTLYRRSGVNSRHCVILESSTNGAPARQSFFLQASHVEPRGPSTGERMHVYNSTAADLAANAARQALSHARLTGADITHLVTASCTGFHAPGIDLALCDLLDLPLDVTRTHIGFMGCHAAINALRVGDAFGRSDPASRVLICNVELCSLHFQYSNRSDHVVSNSLFADGAAALVGHGRDNRGFGTVLSTSSFRLPNTREMMSWKVGDHGFEMSLSPRVPALIRANLKHRVENWLGKHGLATKDVASWAIHPGGPRILDACQDSLQLDSRALEPSRTILANFGNMSSPTVLFVLNEIIASQQHGPCVMLAFGPGLAIEAALIVLA